MVSNWYVANIFFKFGNVDRAQGTITGSSPSTVLQQAYDNIIRPWSTAQVIIRITNPHTRACVMIAVQENVRPKLSPKDISFLTRQWKTNQSRD